MKYLRKDIAFCLVKCLLLLKVDYHRDHIHPTNRSMELPSYQ